MTSLAQQLLAKAKALKAPAVDVRRQEYRDCLPATELLLKKGNTPKQVTDFLIANLHPKERPEYKTPAWWRLYNFVLRARARLEKAGQLPADL